MPRKKKRKGQRGESAVGRKKKLDREKASWWQSRIRAAQKEKEDYTLAAAEIDAYFRASHKELFNSATTREYFMDFRGSVAVSVPKSAQIRNAIGPHLYVQNPARTVAPRTYDGVQLGLSRVLEKYINTTPDETDLEGQSRKRIDDALLRGRGFMQTGWDETREVVTSWFVTSRDVLIDGTAKSLGDAEWIAIRRSVPLFRLKREIKEPWRKKNLQGTHTAGLTIDDPELDPSGEKPTGEDEHAPTNDMVDVWEVYSKMGCGFNGVDFPGSERRNKDQGEDYDFVKLGVVMTHDVLVSEGDWEVPLYLDRDWPIVPLDFVETLDQLWPVSVMGQVLPLQKALDLLTSLSMVNARNRARVILYGDKAEEAHVQQMFKGGGAEVYIGLPADQHKRPINQRFGVINLGTQPPDIAMERQYLTQEFEATTGLTSITTGVSDAGSKDRSATASRLRSQATNARLGHMRELVKRSDTFVARHEALMVRLTLDFEEVEAFCPPEDIGLFLVSIRPPDEWVALYGVAEFPVRDRRSEEEREDGEEELTLEMFGSEVSNYFEDPNAAADALMTALQAIEQMAQEDYRFAHLSQLWDNTGEGYFSVEAMFAMDEMGQQTGQGLPEGAAPRMVTVEDVWRDTAGVTPKQLARELAYSIGTSTGPEWDREAEIESANTLASQALPPAMSWAQQTGDPSPVNAIFKRLDDANGVPDDKRIPPLQAPPPPPQPQPQQQQQGAGA